jgi:hypothetical protein
MLPDQPDRPDEPEPEQQVGATNALVDSCLWLARGDASSALADAVYEQMIKTITSLTHTLERRPASAALLVPDEETLRDWLMFMLSTNYEAPDGSDLFVGGETANPARPRRRGTSGGRRGLHRSPITPVGHTECGIHKGHPYQGAY